MAELLKSQDDLEWLFHVHGIKVPDGGAAILDGNADWPNKVSVYAYDNLFAPVIEYGFDADGNAVELLND